ncbi:MAG TPA: hypothetical protein VGL44_13085 [Gaiellales bacterium]
MSIAVAVLVAAAVVAAGIVATRAVFAPATISLPTRLAAVFGLGYAVAALTPTLLVVAHVFSAAATAIALVVVAAGLAVAARRRCPPRALLASLRDQVRADPAALGAGLVVLALIAVVRIGIPFNPTHGAWRYWADGLELAAAGHVPAASLQWGVLHPPAVSKLAGNAFTGELSFLFATHALAGMAVALWLAVAGYAAGLWALGWELGLRRTAPVLPIAGVAGDHLPFGLHLNADSIFKLTFFQDEDMGRAAAVIAAAMLVAALRGKGGRWAPFAAGVVLAAGALTHAIPALALLALIVPYIALVLLRCADRRHVLLAGAAALVTAAAVSLGLLALAGGDIGFQGASGGAGYTLFDGRFDPTAYLDGILRPPRPKTQARWYERPSATAGELLQSATGKTAATGGLIALALVGLLVIVAAHLLGPPPLWRAAAAAAAMLAILLLVGLSFSYRQSFYIPATFGERRLFEYASIPVMLLALALAEAAIGRLDLTRPWVPAAAGVVLTALAVAVAGPHAIAGDYKTASPTADYVTAARTATPCNARLLATVNSKGAFQALTGREDILEGMAPFLRPSILRSTVRMVHEARQYLLHPVTDGAFLAREHVDDVLVGRGLGAGWKAFGRAPTLRFVRQVGQVRVYRFTGPGVGTGGVRPSDAPGYTCRTTPAFT